MLKSKKISSIKLVCLISYPLPFMVGESDSSESLDSDPDETYESSGDELSPVPPTRVTEIALQAEPVSTTERKEKSGGIVVQQRLGKDIGYQFGLSKDTQDVRNQPPSLNNDVGSGDAQKRVVRHTMSEEKPDSKPTQKVRSRPGSLSLDEDMSYVSAPRFNIPSKRRQYSGSDDAEVQDKKGGFEKHRSKSNEDLIKSEGRLEMNEPSADVIVHGTSVGTKDQDHDISDFVKDIFGTAEKQSSGALTDKIQGKDEGVGTSSIEPSVDDVSLDDKTAGDEASDRKVEVTIHEDIVSKETGITVESSPEIPTESFSVDNNAPTVDSDMSELTPEDESYDEGTEYRESGGVVNSFLDQREPDHQQLDVKRGKLQTPTTDNKRNGAVENARESAVGESGDDENNEALSVLSRVKNWERKSNEDRFGASVVQSKSTIEVKVKEDDKQRGKTVGDKYEVTLDSSGNNEEIYEDVEERQTQDISPVVNAFMEDLPHVNEDQSKPVGRDYSPSPEVVQASGGLDNELKQGSYHDIGLEKSNEAVHNRLPTEDISGETSLNLENTEMILELGSYKKNGLDNNNPAEVIHDDFSSKDLENIEIGLQQESSKDESSNYANPDEAMQYEDFTSQASLLLERNEMESPEESYGGTNSGDVKLDEGMQDKFQSGDTTLEKSWHVENNGMELQESCDDASSDKLNPGEAIENYSLVKDITTPVYELQGKHSESNQDLNASLKGDMEQDEFTLSPELKSEIKSNLEFNSSNNDSSFKTGVKFSASSSLKSNTFVDTEVPAMSVHFEQEKTGTSPLDSEHDDAQNSEEEQGEYQDVEVRPNLDVSATNQDTSPEARDTEIIQPANEEDPTSPEGQINAMRAFSEAFVSTNLGLKGSESREDQHTREDQDSREDHGYREESAPYEDDNSSREDRGYLEDQGTRQDRGYYDDQFDPQTRGYHEEQDPRDDRGYHAESEGPDSRRSSDLHYGGSLADNESMISETSGYGTPSASEDTSSKRTPSISGDEGMNTSREEARRLPSVSTKLNFLSLYRRCGGEG